MRVPAAARAVPDRSYNNELHFAMSTPTATTSQSADPTDETTGRLLPGTALPCFLFRNASLLASNVANEVAELIRRRQAEGRQAVLGLPTGSTPIGVYRELIRMHQDEGLDFSNVVTFNLDEYWPMQPDSVHSYHRWMRENFFDHVNVPEENIHIPDGTLSRGNVERFCADYEKAIAAAGGIDIQMLGIGRTGHIGFNEPAVPARPAPAWSISIRSHAGMRRADSVVKRTSRSARSPWASAPSWTPAGSSSWPSANTRLPSSAGRPKKRKPRKSPPASCSRTPTRR